MKNKPKIRIAKVERICKPHSDEQFLTVLCIGFVTLGPFHCADLFVFICFCFILQLLYYCERGEVDLMGLKPNLQDLSSFSPLRLLVGLFDL